MANLNFDQASKIANETRANARETLTNPIAVAVLDSGGHLIVLEREDGAAFMRPPIAIGKAWGALGLGVGTRALETRLQNVPTSAPFFASIAALTSGNLIPVPGGVLIMDGDEIVGAAGVSGDTSDKDEACAVAGIESTGLVAVIGARGK
ncbi:heme-binding protein [Gammaproteobacteria bacterium]|nr:heme-binding protein [Gammaproteobacteria bacterium]|tara:strand:+ start:160 stop:609 length:450 start_codon:yes stop_codon:yes gene_type:complete